MSGINSTLPLKTINFKASNPEKAKEPVLKQNLNEPSLTEKVFDKPMEKVKYAAGIGAVIGFLRVGFLGAAIAAVEAAVLYLVGAAAVSYLKKDSDKTQ